MGRVRSDAEIRALRAERSARKEKKKEECGFAGLSYEFSQGLVLHIEEDWLGEVGDDGIAGLQWAGGVRLARLFDEMEWKGKRCLELGAGCGLTSCVVAALGGSVVCTDAEIAHARATMEANSGAMRLRAGDDWIEPVCATFEWGPDLPAGVRGEYDVVFAGDCLYAESHAADLLCALCAAAPHENTVVWVCGAVSDDAHRAFRELAPKAFEVCDENGRPLEDGWSQRQVLKMRRRRPPLRAVAPAQKAQSNIMQRLTLRRRPDENGASHLETPSDLLPSILVVDGVLDVDECQKLCEVVKGSGELSFWAGDSDDGTSRRFRDADTVEVSAPEVARELWRRLNLHFQLKLPDVIGNDDEDEWRSIGLNSNFLFADYRGKGGFAPHTDGATREGINVRSYLSVIIYLTEPSEGGETRFYEPKALDHLWLESDGSGWTASERFKLQEDDVKPKLGRVLIFDQRLVHEGRPCKEGPKKLIIRSDVMFERVHRIFDTECDKHAYEIYESAVDHAEHQRHSQARADFQKAMRLSPKLSAGLGL